jgi:hypothetical protein
MYVPVSLVIDFEPGTNPDTLKGIVTIKDANGNPMTTTTVDGIAAGQTLTYSQIFLEVVIPSSPTLTKTAAHTPAPAKPVMPKR